MSVNGIGGFENIYSDNKSTTVKGRMQEIGSYASAIKDKVDAGQHGATLIRIGMDALSRTEAFRGTVSSDTLDGLENSLSKSVAFGAMFRAIGGEDLSTLDKDLGKLPKSVQEKIQGKVQNYFETKLQKLSILKTPKTAIRLAETGLKLADTKFVSSKKLYTVNGEKMNFKQWMQHTLDIAKAAK